MSVYFDFFFLSFVIWRVRSLTLCSLHVHIGAVFLITSCVAIAKIKSVKRENVGLKTWDSKCLIWLRSNGFSRGYS